jgi:hypothetical protein
VVENEEEKKIDVIGFKKSATAVPPIGTGRANLLEFWDVFGLQNLARPCQPSGQGVSKFFNFSRIILGQLPTKHLKNGKQTK